MAIVLVQIKDFTSLQKVLYESTIQRLASNKLTGVCELSLEKDDLNMLRNPSIDHHTKNKFINYYLNSNFSFQKETPQTVHSSGNAIIFLTLFL